MRRVLAWILGILGALGGIALAVLAAFRAGEKRQVTAQKDKAAAVEGELAKSDAATDVRTASIQRVVRQHLKETLAREPTEEEVRELIRKANEP